MNENTLISCTTIDEYLWKVKVYLMKKHGTDQAMRDVYPLLWYVATGRASAAWLRMLMAKTPYNVAKLLHKGGSVDEVMERLHCYIGWDTSLGIK